MIVEATINAIKIAATDYASYSGGDSSWSAPEYFYSTCIAQKIASLRNPPLVTLEYGVAEAIEAAGGLAEGVGADRRFDIVLWDGESPVAVIEVKRAHAVIQQILADVERICDALNNNNGDNTFGYGIIALLVSGQAIGANGQNTFGHLENRISNIRDAILEHVNHYGENLRATCHFRRILPDDEGREFAAVVFRISRL